MRDPNLVRKRDPHKLIMIRAEQVLRTNARTYQCCPPLPLPAPFGWSFFGIEMSFLWYRSCLSLLFGIEICFVVSRFCILLFNLSGPVRDTHPYRAIPFRDSIAEGGIAPICLVFIGYRASIAEIPLLGRGYRTSTQKHALHRGNAQKRGRGYRTQLAMLRHQKTP